MFFSRVHVLSLPLALSSVACLPSSGGDGELTGDSRQEVIWGNGMSLNGMSLNGMSLNGMSLNGMSLNGISLNGMSLNGMSLNGISLNDSQLTGLLTDGEPVSGDDLVGAQLDGILSDGSPLLLRIDSAGTLPAPNADVWAYGVSYALAGGAWAPLCGTHDGAPVLAVPLAGTWNYASGVPGGGSWSSSSTSFTFGCRGTALAKCVELGYKPWQSVDGVSLRDHHQTCTRMLRADYCGDGTPGTINGWHVNLWDDVGVQADTESGAEWVYEANWGANGATCIDEYRALELVTGGHVPACAAARVTHTCGTTGFSPGVLLKTEYNAAGVLDLLSQMADASPSTPVAEVLESAQSSLESGFGALAETPVGREVAAGHFEDAAAELEGAVDDGLLSPARGDAFLARIAGVARFQATQAAADNACGAADPLALADAQSLLAQGDSRRSAEQYRAAVASYRESIGRAESASGARCAP